MNRSFLFFLFIFSTLHVVSQTYQEQLKAIHSGVVEQKDGKSYYIHTVKKGQTLYMISKAYGVEVNDIINENPEVRNGIKSEQKIRIPFPGVKKNEVIGNDEIRKKDVSSKKQVQPVNKSNAPPSKEIKSIKEDTVPELLPPCGSDTLARTRIYKVVLMIPLYLEEVEAFNPETAPQEAVDDWNCLKYLQFYEGMRLAVDSLRSKGLHLRLYVYDIGKDTLKTLGLLKKSEVRTADLIIGLLFHRNFMIVADFARRNNIPVVNPVSDRADILRDNEMVFKISPSRTSQMDCLASYMSKEMYRAQIFIIRNGLFKDRDLADKLKKECQDRKLNVIIAEGQDEAIGKLSKTRENVIVAFTDNNAYALDLMRRFSELKDDYNLRLVGLPDWEDIEGLETDYLNSLNTHIMAMYFADYSDAGVKSFVRRYQQQFNSDPESLAFRGFDVGYYFISALMKYGNKLPVCISGFRLPGTQTTFEFIRSGHDGFENHYWPIYKYENYKLVKAN
jgi:LysM repeat protein/ABC-type branched-subunit amino acid transport system substrate-binding protein